MIRLFSFLCIFAFLGNLTKADEEVSREIPEVVKKYVIPNLTPLSEVVEQAKKQPKSDDPGLVLLREKYYWVAESGKRYRVFHYVYQVTTEQGVKPASRDSFAFDAKETRVHLVSARTVLADGKSIPLADNAAFIQRGRGSHSNQLYNSEKELVLIYPEVKIGSITESVVVLEDVNPRIKNELTGSVFLGSGWPVVRQRTVLDLDTAMAKRLKVYNVGTQVIAKRQSAGTENRQLVVWRDDHLNGSDYEPNREPRAQVGPVVKFGTLANWDALGDWYRKLIVSQQKLPKHLQQLADDWTREAKSREDIIRILYQHVANDVRYTGLEFGVSRLKPYSCKDVWQAKYGDCKDKSNLLCALLNYKGIPAFITLVNTNNKGLIHKQIPRAYEFNHAIVAISPKSGGKEWIYCDPTISYGKPGLLAPSSSNRDVLIITSDKIHWQKTPGNTAGELNYSFDLTLNKQGVLRGWMTLRASGFYGIDIGEDYQSLKREAVLRRLNRLIQSFYAGAVTVDYVIPISKDKQFSDPVVLKAYFTCPPVQSNEQGQMPVYFPTSSNLILDYGESSERVTDYFQWRDTITVDSKVNLPVGWSLGSRPQAWNVSTPYYAIKASWNHIGKNANSKNEQFSYSTKMKISCLKDVVPGEKIAVVQQANRAFAAWIKKPALLVLKADVNGSHQMQNDQAVELSLMPTSKGQLDLVDQLYPLTGSYVQRERALQKALQFYPEDVSVAFVVRARIAYMRYNKGKYDEANKMYTDLFSRPTQGVSSAEVNFARYMYGMCLFKAGKKEQSIQLLINLSEQTDLPAYRQAWTAALLANYLSLTMDGNPERIDLAISYYQKALKLKGDHVAYSVASLYMQLCYAKQTDKAVNEFVSWLKSDPKLAKDIINELNDKITDENYEVLVQPSIDGMAKVFAHLNDHQQLRKMLEDISLKHQKLVKSRIANAELRVLLLQLLEEKNPAYLQKGKVSAEADTREKVEQVMDSCFDKEHDNWLTAATHLFKTYSADAQFTTHLWNFFLYVKWKEFSEGNDVKPLLFDSLVKLTQKIPVTDPNYWECRFVVASWHEEERRWEQAVKIYEEMSVHKDFDQDFRHACWKRMGVAYERLGKLEDAIRAYTKLIDEKDQYVTICEQLFRAGMLYLRLGNYDEALKLWQNLVQVPDNFFQESEDKNDLLAAVHLVQNPVETRKFWEQTDTWWQENLLPLMKSVDAEKPRQYQLYIAANASDVHNDILLAKNERNIAALMSAVYPVLETARWLPSRLADLQQAVYNPALELGVSDFKKVASLLASYTKVFTVGRPNELRVARRLYLAMLIDSGQNELSFNEGKKTIDLLAKEKNPDREHIERCVYLYMLAAQRSEHDTTHVIAFAKKTFQEKLQYVDVNQYLLKLCALLKAKGEVNECLELIEKSGENNPIKNVHYERLMVVKEQLLKERVSRGEFDVYLTSWMKKYKPVWYDFVAPESIEDRKLPEIDDIVAGEQGDLHRIEFLKALLLVSLSKEIQMDKRQEAFASFVRQSSRLKKTWSDSLEYALEAIEMKKGFETLNRSLIWSMYVDCAYSAQIDCAQKCRAHPAYKLVAKSVRDTTGENLLEMCQILDKRNPKVIEGYIKKLSAREMSSRDVATVRSMIGHIIGMGDLETAQKIVDSIKNWKLDETQTKSKLAMRLSFKKMLRKAKRQNDCVKFVYEKNRERIEALAKKAPKGWQSYLRLKNNDHFASEEQDAVDAAMWTEPGMIDRTNMGFWMQYPSFWLYDQDKGEPDVERFGEMIDCVMRSDLPETEKNTMVALFTISNFDVDELVNKTHQLLKAEKIHDLDRSTKEVVMLFCQQAMRYKTNEPVTSLDFIKLQTDDRLLSFFGDGAALSLALAENNPSNIRRVLDEANPDSLLDPHMITAYLDALKVIKDDDMIDLVEEKRKEYFGNDINDLWMTPDESDFINFVDRSVHFGDEDKIPDELIQHVVDHIHPSRHDRVRMLFAYLKKDWKSVVSYAQKLMGSKEDEDANQKKDFSLESYYLGVAYMHLGNKEKAVLYLQPVAEKNSMLGYRIIQAKRYLQTMK